MTKDKGILKVKKSEKDEFVDLPNPQTLQWDLADMEAENCSGYNQRGEYFRDVIARKVTLSATWGALSETEVSSLLEAIGTDSFILEYPDAGEGRRNVITAYVNSRTAPMYCYSRGGQNEEDSWKWQGLSITFMEK